MPKPTKGPRFGGSPAHQRIILANALVDPAGLRWLAGRLAEQPALEVFTWADSTATVDAMVAAADESMTDAEVAEVETIYAGVRQALTNP